MKVPLTGLMLVGYLEVNTEDLKRDEPKGERGQVTLDRTRTRVLLTQREFHQEGGIHGPSGESLWLFASSLVGLQSIAIGARIGFTLFSSRLSRTLLHR
jgi:hypothetical protein